MYDKLKLAAATTQAVLRVTSAPSVAVDGVWGPRSAKALSEAPASIKEEARRLAESFGVSLPEAKAPKRTPLDVFRDKLAPAVARVAKSRGLPVEPVIAQLALESAWGTSGLSANHLNFGGLKYNAVASYPGARLSSTNAVTREYVDDRWVTESAGFAKFDSVEQFADVYVWYLLDGPSSYRYRPPFNKEGDLSRVSDAKGFFSVLKAGGYATDPQYVSKGVSVSKTVASWVA